MPPPGGNIRVTVFVLDAIPPWCIGRITAFRALRLFPPFAPFVALTFVVLNKDIEDIIIIILFSQTFFFHFSLYERASSSSSRTRMRVGGSE